MDLCAERSLREFLFERDHAVEAEILSEDPHALLNANETQYIDYLLGKYGLEVPCLQWDRVWQTERQEMISANRFPSHAFFVEEGHSYPRPVVTFHIPFGGDGVLFQMRPTTFLAHSPPVQVVERELLYELVRFSDSEEQLAASLQRFRADADRVLGFLRNDVDAYNSRLAALVRGGVEQRRRQLLEREKTMAAIGIPWRTRPACEVPDAFKVPITRKPLLVKPEAPLTPYEPEPTLPDSVYRDILKLVRDLGVEMERHPSIYQGKNEKSLRDHFLMVLAPNFDSTTGESFNRAGKTDILIRHENRNVFVAECKFWRGPSTLSDAISQVLSYLTWRDSKAALLVFVPNKELQPVLDAIGPCVAAHPCFVKEHGKQADGWFSFELHLPDDPTRSVHLALLCFHLPDGSILAATTSAAGSHDAGSSPPAKRAGRGSRRKAARDRQP